MKNREFEYLGNQHKLSAPILKIRNFYTEDECSQIWSEIEFLSQRNKFKPPNQTGAAFDINHVSLKDNLGLFLDSVYADRDVSNILYINRNLFDPTFIEQCVKFNPLFRYIESCNRDFTLLSYYGENCKYDAHSDMSALSCISYFYKEPRCFDGGDLHFPDYDLTIEIENNMMIIFPSCLLHQVLPVKTHKNYVRGFGRYSITQFLQSAVNYEG